MIDSGVGVGFGRASELCLSGRTFDAEEAGAINMVEQVVPPERLMERALEVAASFAENSTLALLRTKQLIDANISEPSLETVHARETKVFEECAASPEHKAAIASFLARAQPWPGGAGRRRASQGRACNRFPRWSR